LETIDQLIKTSDLQEEIEEISLETIHFGGFTIELSQKIGFSSNLSKIHKNYF